MGCFFKEKNANFCTSKCNILWRFCDCNWLWIWTELEMIPITDEECFCHLSQHLSLSLFSPLQNLIKFIFDLLNGRPESDGEERGETKEAEAEKTFPSGYFSIGASGSTGSRAGPLCFQMLHRLVPALYNCYVTYTDDPDASALLEQRGQICSHLQSINLYPMIMWRKWQSRNS